MTRAVERLAFPAGGLRLYKHQQATWDARRVHGFKRRITNDHRQSGKDVAALVDLLDQAMHEPGVYAYIGPTRQMVENIAWHGVRASDGGEYLSIVPAPLLLDRNEADLSLEIATIVPGRHSRVLFLSGNEPARVRGLPLKGVVVTEYSQFENSEILDTILPALNRSGGDLLVLSTPLGVGGHYHALWRMAQDSADWWTATRTIDDTVDHAGRPLIDPGLIERELAQGQREAVGFQLIPLAHPVGVWPLLAVSPRGLTLAAPVPETPNLMGGAYQVPAGWPLGTVRLILIWGTDPLPKALTLS